MTSSRLKITKSPLQTTFAYSGFNSTGSDRDGPYILRPSHDHHFYVSHEQVRDQCPNVEHKFWKDCKPDCKKTKVGTRRYAAFPQWMNFYDFYKSLCTSPDKKWKTFYEIILGRKPHRPYFDLDFKGIDEKEANIRVELVKKAIKDTYPDIGVIVTYESHGDGKFSFHLVCRDVSVASHEHCRVFALNVNKTLPPGYIDMAVYSSLQNFRLYGSTKRGKYRFKTIIAEDLTTHYSDEKVQAFNSVKPIEDVRDFMIFRDSLISVTGDTRLLDITVPERKKKQVTTHDFSEEELASIEGLIPEGYSIKDRSGVFIGLQCTDRSIPCLVCKRPHEHENPYITIRNNKVYFCCRRAQALNEDVVSYCLGVISLSLRPTPSPVPPLPMDEDTMSVGSTTATHIDGGSIRWPGRPLEPKKGVLSLRHSAVYLVYTGLIEELKCLDTLRAKPFGIKSISWKAYSNGSTTHTAVEVYFDGRVERKVDDLFTIGGQSPVEIRVLATGARKFILTEHLNALHNPDDEKLTNEDIMELVKHCQSESEVYRVAKEPRYNAMFLRIWKANNNEVKRITKMVEHCTIEKQVFPLFPDLATANKALTIWRQMRRTARKSPVTREQLWPWQRQWEEMLLAKGDSRMVKVIIDDHGNTKNDGGNIGKGTFGQYMKATYPEQVCYCPNVGDIRDMATAIETDVKEGWTGKIILIDLARPAKLNADLYQFIEQMCNGEITILKYSSRFLSWLAEHIVIVTNRYLDITKLSSDRWQLYTANDPQGTIPGTPRVGSLVTIDPITYDYALQKFRQAIQAAREEARIL